jgi:two-component system capsular synthesis sensor histidine kinase RcsC
MTDEQLPLVTSMLVTEDDPVLKRFYEQALENICENLTVVDSPHEAMNMLKVHQFEFLITDLKLSEKNGLDIITYAVQHCPKIIVLVASGYVSDTQYQAELQKVPNIKGFLQKPFTLDDLTRKIASMVSPGGTLRT